jgi:hypothetical protein
LRQILAVVDPTMLALDAISAGLEGDAISAFRRQIEADGLRFM